MPAVPIIAAVSGASAAIGAAAATAVGLGTVGTLAATAIGTGIIAGGMTAVQGGDVSDVLESAVIGGVTTYVGGTVANAVGSTVAEVTGSQIAGSAAGGAAQALVSGGDSEDILTSGLLGGISGGINEAKLAAADEYLNSLPGGYGEYSDLPPDMSDFDLPPAVIDTSFTPDYSLSSGAPVIPDMGAQGIQVPTINELVDVVNQPVDYSLPVPDSGFGLQMPTVPNLDAMGGGQGITVPIDGGTLTEAGVIPDMFVSDLGDPNSFINQPAPDVSVNIPELAEQTPVDIDTELSLLNAAQGVAPAIVNSLLADKAVNQPEQRTGFDIVPIPGDWRSPEYNMAFTPSAAINFGSPEMLAGTQWSRPMDVSTLINSLNLQQPQQQFSMNEIVGRINDVPMSINDIINNLGQNTMQPFDMNQTIGQLDNAPASLNSIISGIQSQYG
jgi:hypothetical protein